MIAVFFNTYYLLTLIIGYFLDILVLYKFDIY